MPSGDWLAVPYIPGSFAVNSGDIMKRWTNGDFKSTPHRALPPVGHHRYAIPFFLGPRFDQLIECLPTCTGPGNPPKWPPITYAEWQGCGTTPTTIRRCKKTWLRSGRWNPASREVKLGLSLQEPDR